jgi:hypothetical protein
MPTTIVPDGRSDRFWNGIQVRKQLPNGFALKIRIPLQRGVKVVDVTSMMLAVMDFHGPSIDMRLERIKLIWKCRQLKSHSFFPPPFGEFPPVDRCNGFHYYRRDISFLQMGLYAPESAFVKVSPWFTLGLRSKPT